MFVKARLHKPVHSISRIGIGSQLNYRLQQHTTTASKRTKHKMESETSKMVTEQRNTEEKRGHCTNDDNLASCGDIGMLDCVDVNCINVDCINVDFLDCCFQCLSLPFKLCLGLCLD